MTRPRVLMLAFACEPNIGSEPEVGWRWALEMSHYADVTVVTDEGHRGGVEAAIGESKSTEGLPDFVFIGPGPAAYPLFRWFGYRSYYPWWMKLARARIARLHGERPFDLMHHVTYAGCRYSTAVWNQGVPVVWGPVGGMEPMPLDIIPWSQPKTAIFEVARNIGNHLSRGHLRKGGRLSSVVLASTRETRDAFLSAGIRADLMATIGIENEVLTNRIVTPPSGSLKLLFAGRLLALKGLALAILALAKVPGVRFTIIGDGPFGGPARALVDELALNSRVEFRPSMSRSGLIQEYREHDVLIYPSMHDSGGFVVLEAMANGLPVICVDCGGPGIAVKDGCGIRVPLQSRDEMVDGLATAIERYESNRQLVAGEGNEARRSVEVNYVWSRKAERMARYYAEAIGKGGATSSP